MRARACMCVRVCVAKRVGAHAPVGRGLPATPHCSQACLPASRRVRAIVPISRLASHFASCEHAGTGERCGLRLTLTVFFFFFPRA